MDSVDEWGLRGHGLTKEPTVVGLPKTPKDITVPVAIAAQLRPVVLVGDPKAGRSAYLKVFVASGKAPPARTPEGFPVTKQSARHRPPALRLGIEVNEGRQRVASGC